MELSAAWRRRRRQRVYFGEFGTGPYSALDYATIAYSSAGVLLWTNRYNGPGNRNDVTGVIIRNTIVTLRQASRRHGP